MSKKVMIVDDEEGVRESLNVILEDAYDTILVENGPQAIEMLRRTPDVGLVLLDIKLPKMNGLDVLTQMRTLRPDLNVLMVTGYRAVETAKEAVDRGAVGYIVKPFDRPELRKTVGKYI